MFALVQERREPFGVLRFGGQTPISVEEAFVLPEVGDGVAVAVLAEIVDGERPLAGQIAVQERHERIDLLHLLSEELPGPTMPDEADLVLGLEVIRIRDRPETDSRSAGVSGAGCDVLERKDELELVPNSVEPQAKRINVSHVVADLPAHSVLEIFMGRVPELEAPEIGDARVAGDLVEFPDRVHVRDDLGHIVVPAPERIIRPLTEVTVALQERELLLESFGSEFAKREGRWDEVDFFVADLLPGERKIA